MGAETNLLHYKTAGLICRDAIEVVPEICRQQQVDLIVFDPNVDYHGAFDRLLMLTYECRPTWWILNNIQHEHMVDTLLSLLLEDGHHELVLHDFSPTLIAYGWHGALQEFMVLRRLPARK